MKSLNLKARTMISFGGVVGLVLGTSIMIPAMLNGNYWLSIAGGLLVMFGLVLFGISFSEPT